MDIRTGNASADTFDGSVNANGTATFTSVDQLDGGAGNDTVIAGLAGGNIATKLSNIETGEFITSAATTLDLINTTGMNTLTMRNSSAALTVNNIASTTATTIQVQDQASDFNLNFTNSALVGTTNAFTLKLSGAQSDADGGAAVAISQQAGSDASGLESVTVESNGANSNFLASLASTNAAAASTINSLTVTGAQGLRVTTALDASVRTVDASGMTGASGLTASFGATAAATVTGSGGADAITFTANAADSTVNGGAGNDTITITNFTTADSIAGGDGTADRLNISATDAEAIVANLTNTTGFEQLSLSSAGSAGASINATRFGAIDTVRLDNGTGAGTYGVTMQAGTVTVGVASTTQTLGGALTVTDTGTATTDVLNLTNRNTTSATNNFNAQNITSAGYETVNLSTGSAATAAQTVGIVTINNDSLSAANTLNVSGANSLTVGNLVSNSSGLLTVNASGLTGTALLSMSAAPTFSIAAGTMSITGSANGDTLRGTATEAATVDGGAGADTITVGSAADSVTGGAGNDTITAGGGNDTVAAGDGNDNITMAAGTVSVDGGAGNDTVNMDATLTASDVVAGGDGTDTLQLDAVATAATAAGVTGFETLSIDTAFNQGMEQFTNNSGFTKIAYNVNGNVAVSNASATISDIELIASGTLSLARLVDTSSNSLNITVQKDISTATQTVTALTADNEETISINTGTAADTTPSNGTGNALTITTLNAADLTTLNVSGANAVIITNAIGGATNLATINASGLTAALTVNASTSVANMTVTGVFAAANTVTGGTGSDTMTGGTAADSLTGGNGADSISGGADADTLDGGAGNDTILGDIGDDSITGGAGNDALTGGSGADDFVFSASNGVDSISDFVTGTDDLVATTNTFGGAIAGTTTVTSAAAAISLATFFTDNTVHYYTFNGAAANLTINGTATLSSADLTATTLTNLAAYLNEKVAGATSGASANDVVLVLNWSASGNTNSYVYEIVNDGSDNAMQAAEITLLGVVTHAADAVLVAGDVI